MGTIHFVYVRPGPAPRFGSGIAGAVERLARSAREKLRRAAADNGGPLPAPYSITVNLHRFLAARHRVRLYDWRERGTIELQEDDILLGHPHADPETMVQRTLRGGARCKFKALMFPIHHAMPEISEFTLPLIEQADLVFGVTGPYWYDTLSESHFAPWKEKIVRLDLAVDAAEFPLVKQRFNAPGKRGYLYIGNNRPEKGGEVLSATLERLGAYPRGWVGGGPDIAHVPRLAGYRPLTPEFVTGLAGSYDIFVNTSLSDANPATILEAMAWGFPVACTPESGYYNMPTIVSLSTTDIDANVAALEELQHAPEERLHELSRANRALVETQYTWERFCGTVWGELQKCM
ncbi:MAG: glycosyltransferase family 4 protein [Acidobacteria bacterium]|nr:glycosyltransferase family 4 protein [Acidobacteriota bacterium]